MAPICALLERYRRGLTAIGAGSVRLPIAGNESRSHSFAPTAVNRPPADEIAPDSPATGNRRRDESWVFCQALNKLSPQFHEGLTLIASYPFDALIPGGPLRFVVFAKSR